MNKCWIVTISITVLFAIIVIYLLTREESLDFWDEATVEEPTQIPPLTDVFPSYSQKVQMLNKYGQPIPTRFPGVTVPQGAYSPLTDNIEHVYPYPMFDGIGWSIASGGVPPSPIGEFAKIGIVTDASGNGVVFDLFEKTVGYEIYEYLLSDKNGFTIPLKSPHGQYTNIVDGDIIPSVVGYEKYGPFKVTIFNPNGNFFLVRS